MRPLGSKLVTQDSGRTMFLCPGCSTSHVLSIAAGGWGFNGDGDNPTFTPSVLVTGRDFTPSGQAAFDAWHAAGCPALDSKKFDSAPTVCHSFITNGRIQFLDDCTHGLAGQSVDLPDWSEI